MQVHNGRRAVVFAGLAVAWCGVLFFFSGQSGADSGSLSKGFARLLFGWLIEKGVSARVLEHVLRKIAHFSIFAVEGFLAGMSLMSMMRMRTAILLGGAASACVAVANEVHQLFSEGRACSVIDMGIDTLGALTGILVAAAILHAFSTFRRNKEYR